MPGKGAYEVHQEEYFAEFDGQDQEEAPRLGFGGGDIDAIGIERPWTHVVRKARSLTDMRPMRWQLKKCDGDNACHDNVICSVERDRPQTIGAVQQLIEGWERIAMKVDSGAIDTVMPPNTATRFAVRATDQSVNGSGFRAANGTAIKHHGQKHVQGWSDNFQPLTMVAQVADVKATLGSVHQMLKAGNVVHFEPGNCFIRNVQTGARTTIEEKNGMFEVGVWVRSAARAAPPASTDKIKINNRFQVLQEESEQDTGFPWQG